MYYSIKLYIRASIRNWVLSISCWFSIFRHWNFCYLDPICFFPLFFLSSIFLPFYDFDGADLINYIVMLLYTYGAHIYNLHLVLAILFPQLDLPFCSSSLFQRYPSISSSQILSLYKSFPDIVRTTNVLLYCNLFYTPRKVKA